MNTNDILDDIEKVVEDPVHTKAAIKYFIYNILAIILELVLLYLFFISDSSLENYFMEDLILPLLLFIPFFGVCCGCVAFYHLIYSYRKDEERSKIQQVILPILGLLGFIELFYLFINLI